MSDPEHLGLLKQGVEAWNARRPRWPDLRGASLPGLDLSEIALDGADLSDSILRGVKLDKAQLRGVFLSGSDLSGASMRGANLYYARLVGSDLSDADLQGASLRGATLDGAKLVRTCLAKADLMAAHLRAAIAVQANLSGASLLAASLISTDLTRANLSDAILGGASLVQTVVERATFDRAMVYGIAAWDLVGQPASSEDLAISSSAPITVSDLRVAQFVYLMLENREIRSLIDALTSKVVLILGRLTGPRKQSTETLRAEMQRRGFVPVVFDFEKPADRDLTETITLLARLARFIVADLSDSHSVPQELYAIAPHVEVPIQPIVDGEPWATFEDLRKYPWVLALRKYDGNKSLLATIDDLVSAAERKRCEIVARRASP